MGDMGTWGHWVHGDMEGQGDMGGRRATWRGTLGDIDLGVPSPSVASCHALLPCE